LTVRVGVNLLWLLPGAAAGAEAYAVRLLHALGDHADDVEVVLLCNRRFPVAHPDLVGRFETVVAPIDGGVRTIRIAAESTWLVGAARRAALDLLHHLNDVVPWRRNRPSVLTIHDLRSIERPETIGRWHGSYLRHRLPPSARAAAAIATPSAFVRGTVIEHLGVPADRVRVVSAPVLPPPQAPNGHRPVGRPFFLYPAVTRPHKNHALLIDAFADVVASDPDVLLLLPGGPGPAEPAVRELVARRGLEANVRRLGRVPAPLLAALLGEATALTFPSTYEGFGLPIAEAMATGCPVIASNVTAIPEVVGAAGILVDAGDRDAWSAAMVRVLVDEGERSRLAGLGRERARAMTPAVTARHQLEVYRSAVAARPVRGR
jgi:glycosyltransferase involved in cell wall biosynthesis